MMILKYWKEVSPAALPGVKIKIVPEQTVKQNEAFFDVILDEIQKSDLSYVLYEQSDRLITERL